MIDQGEVDRLLGRVKPVPVPRGWILVAVTLALDEDASNVEGRFKELFAPLFTLDKWPDNDSALLSALPDWFQRASHDRTTTAFPDDLWETDEWLAWINRDQREWRWWRMVGKVNAGHYLLEVIVPGWPTAIGALRWACYAVGAMFVEIVPVFE